MHTNNFNEKIKELEDHQLQRIISMLNSKQKVAPQKIRVEKVAFTPFLTKT